MRDMFYYDASNAENKDEKSFILGALQLVSSDATHSDTRNLSIRKQLMLDILKEEISVDAIIHLDADK